MKICYFGIYNPDFSRNRIYQKGLRENGVEIIECRDNSRGFLKFVRLFLKHWKIRNDYDVMIVGYPGHIVVPLAKIISKKKVVFDALCTMYEGVYMSRKQGSEWSLKVIYIKMVDWLAVRFADIVLVESENQRKYFEEKFGQSQKYKVVYTGADDEIYYRDESVVKKEKFTVVFRGKFLPEAGVKYVVEAAWILSDKDVDFLIIGNGFLEREVKLQIEGLKLKNLEWISEYLSDDELREKMSECHISLGQFENHERLSRTIPHKCFESLAMGLPYVTAKASAVAEILEDNKTGFFVHTADWQDLASKILQLKNSPALLEQVSKNEINLFKEKFSPKVLAENILKFI
jgi:glycosyltransferase involved in cell wall biosynthesis